MRWDFYHSQVNCSSLWAAGITNISKERGWGCQNHPSVFQRTAMVTLCSATAHGHQDKSLNLSTLLISPPRLHIQKYHSHLYPQSAATQLRINHCRLQHLAEPSGHTESLFPCSLKPHPSSLSCWNNSQATHMHQVPRDKQKPPKSSSPAQTPSTLFLASLKDGWLPIYFLHPLPKKISWKVTIFSSFPRLILDALL